MTGFIDIIRNAPKVQVGGQSNHSTTTFVSLIKKLNSKYNIGFDTSKLQKEFKEAQKMLGPLIDRYAYWEGRLTDAIDRRDDFDQILDEFQKEAAKLVV